MSKPASKPADEVGDRFSLTIERHKNKPLWRLRERSVVKGKPFEKTTEWRAFPEFSPDLLLTQGRLKSFLFGHIGARLPTVTRGA